MDLTLSYRQSRWVAYNDDVSFSGKNLDELDKEIKTFIIHSGLLKGKREYRVKMFFNNAELPAWIRQYAQHYFNRELIIKAHQEEEK